MDKFIVAVRGFFCVMMLAALSACGGGGSDSSATVNPSQPSSSNTPAGLTPPAAVANPPAIPVPVTEESTPGTPVPALPGNSAPQIAGTPAEQVNVGQAYSFTPNAADADGDALTFSISSQPSWASFNTATGRLSGTPSASQVGSHEEIAISVTDGHSTVTLAQFAIHVVQVSNGTVTLAWQAPTQNTDGSALLNLNGYKIHYGTQSGHYTSTISVTNAGLTRYVIDNLQTGTYFFAITALSGNGTESELSGEASKTL